MGERGGYVWYIRKALEKGFSDMYGSWGGRSVGCSGTTVGESGVVGQFSTDFGPFSLDFGPVGIREVGARG